MTAARGLRNHNPGNIRWGDPWQGLVPEAERTDQDFCQFISPKWGIRAICKVLQSYDKKYKINTVEGVISRWAPPNENNTQAYINSVCRQTGFHPNAIVNPFKYSDLLPLVRSIILHENGEQPYGAEALAAGLRLAGVEPGKEERRQSKAAGGVSGAVAAAVVAVVVYEGGGKGPAPEAATEAPVSVETAPAPASTTWTTTATVVHPPLVPAKTVAYGFAALAVVLFAISIFILVRRK